MTIQNAKRRRFNVLGSAKGGSGRTDSLCQMETIEGARQEQERQSNKNWAIKFKRRQRADPSSAYTQRRGLLEEPAKPPGGYRRYPAGMVKRIRFIKRAQTLGFTLEEVAGLLRLNGKDACAKTRGLAAGKLALIEQKLSELAIIRDSPAKLVGQCDRNLKPSACPIIEILQWDSRVDPSANGTSHDCNPGRRTRFALYDTLRAVANEDANGTSQSLDIILDVHRFLPHKRNCKTRKRA